MRNEVCERHEAGDTLPYQYAEIWKVCVSGEEPVLEAACNAISAIERASETMGMPIDSMKKLGVTVTTPEAAEIMSFARDRHKMVRMRVQHEGYPDYVCNAYCRMDAKLQAANAWGADYLAIERTAKCGVSPHCLE